MAESNDDSLDYLIDLARAGFEDDLLRLMGDRTRSELAEAVGVSAAFVSKVLNGSTNYTLKTMAKFGRAVGGILQVRLIDEHYEVVRIVSPETASRLDDAGLTTVGSERGHAFARSERADDGPRVLGGPWRFVPEAASEDDNVPTSDDESTTSTLRSVLVT